MVIHLITRLAMGGAQQLVYDITKRMHESGEKVLILTGLSNEKTSLSAKNNRILEDVRAAALPVEVCPCLHDRISLLNDIRAFMWIYRKVREHDPAIVHIHSSKTGILGRLACALAGVKRVVYHVHGWSFSRAEGATRSLYVLLERIFYWLTAEYIFVCRQDMLDFIQLGGNPEVTAKSHVVYPGADYWTPGGTGESPQDIRQRHGFSDEDFLIGSVGRLDYQKNPEMFISIAHLYADVNERAHFVWIGEGDDRVKVEAQIKRLNLTDRVTLLGYVEEVDPYFAVLDTFAMTSRYEGLPLTVIKSLGCGTPVVGFLTNGMNDLNDKYSSVLGVPKNDVDEFVRQLDVAFGMATEDSAVLKEDAKAVRETMNRSRMYEQIMSVYAATSGSESSAPPPGNSPG